MNAIEIRDLSKSFRGMYAVDHLNMTVPVGAIYGFIGENGSGKSTTQKMICGLIPKSGGSIRLYGKDHTDAAVRASVGVLIEAPGCFPGLTVWDNLMLQVANLGLQAPESAVLGGAICSLSFDLGSLSFFNLVMCMLAKICLMLVFVSIFTLIAVSARQRAWLSICGSLGGGMLLFMTVPMITPLGSTPIHLLLCLAGGAMCAVGRGAISKTVLKRSALV